MSGISTQCRWFLGMAIGGAIALSANCALAQIKPVSDNTLGAESSIVTPNVVINGIPSDRIDGGAIRGRNLFHSFQEFNIDSGRGAYFTNPTGIENIFSRVTGSNASKILGTLGVLGNANLFLINPNGIVFKDNAALDIRGSFVASTARSLVFADGTQFSTTKPQTAPLLTVSVPIGLQFGTSPSGIQVQDVNLLDVQSGVTRALVGGDVVLDDSGLRARGGRVELGGLAEAGTVNLAVNNNDISLNFPATAARADVSLLNGSVVNVLAGGGGSITVNAQNLNLKGGSNLKAGIASNLGSVDSKAGDININATGAIKLTDGSFINNLVGSGSQGKGGDINIQAESISSTDGSNVIASTFGIGDAGNVTINARDTVSFDGVRQDNNYPYGGVYSRVETNAYGKGGNINITTGSLTLRNGAVLTTSIDGRGDAGNVNIQTRDTIFFAGESSIDGQSSGAFSALKKNATGHGGDINITTGSLSVTNGAQMVASTLGQGDAGNVNIKARDTVSFDGQGIDFFSSGAYSRVESTGVGQGGNVNITANSLKITNGAVLQASTNGTGNAGSVNINAGDTVSFDGEGSFINPQLGYRISSGAYSQVEKDGMGKGGNVNVTTGSLFATNGGVLSTTIRGRGYAGDVNINARDAVSFDGESSSKQRQSSGAFSAVLNNSQGGSINIETGSLSVTNGAQMVASTLGQGDAGNVNIKARDAVFFDGVGVDLFSSGVYSRVETTGIGQGGNVKVMADSLRVTNGAVITTSTDGQGKAGNVSIHARDVVFDGVGSFNPALSELNFRQYSGAFSAVKKNGMGEGGNVNVTAQSLRITNGAELQASTFGKGKAGNVSINAHDIVLDGVGSNGFSSGVFSTVDKDAVGSGGGIDITTKSLSLTNGAELSSTSQGSNNAAGNINVTARSIGLNNKGIISADTQGGEGNINLYFRDYLIMRRGSGITTKAKGTNVTGGNITIDAKNGFIVAVPQENSDISANSDDFRGGQVKINATGIFGTQFRNAPTLLSDITATGKDSSLNGIVQINTPGIDPTRGLVQLPINLVDATQQIDNSCNLGSKYRASSFVVTGRGGLPPNPREPLSSDAVQVDWVTLNPRTENRSRPYVTKNLTPATPAQIIQATGWMRNAKGEVVLTADAPTATSHSSRQTPASCGTAESTK